MALIQFEHHQLVCPANLGRELYSFYKLLLLAVHAQTGLFKSQQNINLNDKPHCDNFELNDWVNPMLQVT